MLEGHEREIDGTHADLRSTGTGREGGACTASGTKAKLRAAADRHRDRQRWLHTPRRPADPPACAPFICVPGCASQAAAFLKRFVMDGVKWSHIDIAGPAMTSKARGHVPAGATGFGADTLVRFVAGRAGS